MVLEDFDGDLEAVLDGPVDRALRTLARFPMIGRPGAEKILLFARRHAVLALESNGLRVLVRLGYGREDPRYEKTYASVRTAVSGELRDDFDWLISLHRLLRRHGQDVCRRTRPECDGCLLSQQCPKVGVA